MSGSIRAHRCVSDAKLDETVVAGGRCEVTAVDVGGTAEVSWTTLSLLLEGKQLNTNCFSEDHGEIKARQVDVKK